jgi:hypothetical protein
MCSPAGSTCRIRSRWFSAGSSLACSRGRLRQFRIRRLKVRLGKMEDEDGIEERSLAYQRLMHEILSAERAALIELRNQGAISAEVIGRVMRELDLDESRLEI